LDKIKNISAVLFDVDDTLFDRKAAQGLVLETIVEKLPDIFHGIEIERIKAAFIGSDLVTTRDFDAGAPSEGLRDIRSRLFLRYLGISEEYAETVTNLYVHEYPTVNAPVPGAYSVVSELAAKYATGVVSNGFPDVQYTKLATIGLKDKFACIVLSEETGIRKPASGIFARAASLLNLQPGECLYTGNSYINDMVGAANAGMMACWFNRDSVMPEDGGVRADAVISDLKELAAILQ